MSELHRNVIGGEWVAGEAIPNFNPSNTDEVVGLYGRASADDAMAAIAAARDASHAWSRSGIQQRHG
jgi:aldehyde dehydrogenase (NAD+)